MLGIRPFGDVLDEHGLHRAAEMVLRLLARDVVLVGPAEVADRPEIDEAGLDRLRGGEPARREGGRRRGDQPAAEQLIE